MAMRDLIPWGRQEGRAPTLFREEERSPLLGLRRDIDRLFEDFFREPLSGLSRSLAAWPSVEVSRTDKEVRVTAELPGMSQEDVELLLEDGVLTIRGERRTNAEEGGYSERFHGRFERSIAIPCAVDEAGAKADFRDGILTVTLPRSAEAERGRRIPIAGGTRH